MTPHSQQPAALSDPTCRVYVAGHRGMVGSAILRLLQGRGYEHIVTRTSAELDLSDQAAVRAFFDSETIDYVVLAAARVGGIHANNTYPADFIRQNLLIQSNVIHEACRTGVKGLLFLGSSCIYPKFAPQPLREEYLLTGPLEPTNDAYAVAKIAGIKMCEAYNRQHGTDYRAVMPTNLYGPGDSFHLEDSHVIPAIIRKYHLAKLVAAGDFEAVSRDEARFGPVPEGMRSALALGAAAGESPPVVQLWGSGAARREFLHVDDMAAACYHVMTLARQRYEEALAPLPAAGRGPEAAGVDEQHGTSMVRPSFINIGTGKDSTIREVAELIRQLVGFTGETRYDSGRPDGTPRKLLDISRIKKLGWQPRFSLRSGLEDAYAWYCRQSGVPE